MPWSFTPKGPQPREPCPLDRLLRDRAAPTGTRLSSCKTACEPGTEDSAYVLWLFLFEELRVRAMSWACTEFPQGVRGWGSLTLTTRLCPTRASSCQSTSGFSWDGPEVTADP